MTYLSKILEHNQQFVENKEYEQYETTKFPDKKMVILSCMDTRLQELLPKAMNVKNGDVKIIKNAGAMVSHPFGSIMRSIIIAVYELEAEEVYVVGHHDCGMANLHASSLLEKSKKHGITDETVEMLTHAGIDLKSWLTGFDSVEESVKNSVDRIKNHPLISSDIPVHGLVIDPGTGKLELIVDGFNSSKE
ncbi:carbonic anhydrase [Salipaludibacillus neizhouensis]|uniref:carbonic anhydrase n=1 Tax=Salipaludibacillus neizhouensis TaxID=885475 RepID=A0A3A9KAK4_9BACI|nr:carbonic anhydrase [Salipaludibacillus neizhouensis]RKL68618.1 carbonic anhydrase [Salipaludibacillus neizhouensis]